MVVRFLILVCAFVITAHALYNTCDESQCDHDLSMSTLVTQSLCKLLISRVYSAHAVFISSNKVLSQASILYASQYSETPLDPKNVTIFLPSNAEMSTDNTYAVDELMIPGGYKHPSYKFNVAVLILENNGKLPAYNSFPNVHKEEEEDNRRYDLIGFSGGDIIKDTISTHHTDSDCGIYFNVAGSDHDLKVNYDYNFCATRTCSECAAIDGGCPAVFGNLIGGIYLAGMNDRKVSLFARLSKHYGFIKNALAEKRLKLSSLRRSERSSSNPWSK